MYPVLPFVLLILKTVPSFSGRNITGLKISRNGSFRKQAFVLEGGSIGADWLSPVILTYIINQLLTAEGEARDASVDFDWYFFPVSNPDGFEFTQDSVSFAFVKFSCCRYDFKYYVSSSSALKRHETFPVCGKVQSIHGLHGNKSRLMEVCSSSGQLLSIKPPSG